MADVYKTLGQGLVTTSWTTLYNVPYPSEVQVGGGSGPIVTPESVVLPKQTLVTSVIVCNYALVDYFYLSLEGTDDGEDPGDPAPINYLFYHNKVFADGSLVLSLGLTLVPGDYLKMKADTVDTLTITAMGIETT